MFWNNYNSYFIGVVMRSRAGGTAVLFKEVLWTLLAIISQLDCRSVIFIIFLIRPITCTRRLYVVNKEITSFYFGKRFAKKVSKFSYNLCCFLLCTSQYLRAQHVKLFKKKKIRIGATVKFQYIHGSHVSLGICGLLLRHFKDYVY